MYTGLPGPDLFTGFTSGAAFYQHMLFAQLLVPFFNAVDKSADIDTQDTAHRDLLLAVGLLKARVLPVSTACS